MPVAARNRGIIQCQHVLVFAPDNSENLVEKNPYGIEIVNKVVYCSAPSLKDIKSRTQR